MTNDNEVDIQALGQVVSWLDAAGVEFAEIRCAGATVRMTLDTPDFDGGADGAGAIAAASPSSSPSALRADRASIVEAPTTGVFVATHPYRTAPLTAPGHGIETGDVVALLQIAELYRPVVVARAGVVSAVLAQTGDMVGYGTPLFELAAGQPPQTVLDIERESDGN